MVSGGNGGPADSTLFYTLYLYQRGLRPAARWATPRRMAWVLLLIIGVLTALNFYFSQAMGLLR